MHCLCSNDIIISYKFVYFSPCHHHHHHFITRLVKKNVNDIKLFIFFRYNKKEDVI